MTVFVEIFVKNRFKRFLIHLIRVRLKYEINVSTMNSSIKNEDLNQFYVYD